MRLVEENRDQARIIGTRGISRPALLSYFEGSRHSRGSLSDGDSAHRKSNVEVKAGMIVKGYRVGFGPYLVWIPDDGGSRVEKPKEGGNPAPDN